MKKWLLMLLTLSALLFAGCGDSDSGSENVPGGNDPENPVVEEEPATREELISALQDVLSTDPDYDASSEVFTANLTALVEDIFTAAGESGIKKSYTNLNRIARYVMYAYSLTDYAAFVADGFSDVVSGITADTMIARIAQSTSTYSVAVPLESGDLPGNDNEARIAYYFNSDISFYYTAEALINLVRDDTVNDAIMYEVARVKAEYGLFDDAELVVDAMIFGTQAKGDACLSIASRLLDYGKTDRALEQIGEAESLYMNLIEAKGEENFSTQDSFNLQMLSTYYRRAGNNEKSQEHLDYLEHLAETYLLTTTTYGRLTVATRNQIDEYIEEGDLETADELAEALLEYAKKMPANMSDGQPTSYKMKVYTLCDASLRFAELGNAESVLEIYQLVESIRDDDGLPNNETGKGTWVYMSDLLYSLFATECYDEAMVLGTSLAESTDASANSKSSGFKAIASSLALAGGLGELSAFEPASLSEMSAIDVITYKLTSDRDRVEALTYYGVNTGTAYVALSLIEAGGEQNIVWAKEALSKANQLLGSYTESSDALTVLYRITRGYAKLAKLYIMIGDSESLALAAEALLAGESVAAGLNGASPRVDAYIALAAAYREYGDEAKVEAMLANAQDYADVYASTNPSEYEDIAELYKDVIDACLDNDVNDSLSTVISKFFTNSEMIHVAGGTEDQKITEVEYLVDVAERCVDINDIDMMNTVLAKAEKLAETVANETDRVDLFVYQYDSDAHEDFDSIIEIYAYGGEFDKAVELAYEIETLPERYLAVRRIAEIYCRLDLFPNTASAVADTDRDGKPDFFHPLALAEDIAASGLVLDDDCDGDGIADVSDIRPWYAD